VCVGVEALEEAADSCRGSAARAMQASQPDPQRSTVEFKEARGGMKMQERCQRGGSHGSEARIEGKGVEEAVEEGKKVRGFRGNHTKITETCLVRR